MTLSGRYSVLILVESMNSDNKDDTDKLFTDLWYQLKSPLNEVSDVWREMHLTENFSVFFDLNERMTESIADLTKDKDYQSASLVIKLNVCVE